MNKWFAEAMGSFAIVFFGCGAIVVNDLYGGVIGHMGVAAIFGLIVMLMIYALGNISGAHFNPAVTIGFVAAGRMAMREAPGYIVAQLLGAIVGALLLKILFSSHTTLGTALPQGDLLQTFIMELVLTFTLMLVILNVSTGHMEKGIMAGVAIGGFVAVAAGMGGPISMASMNPARSLGPAIVSGSWHAQWVYLLATVSGALLAYPSCRVLQGSDCCNGVNTQDNA